MALYPIAPETQESLFNETNIARTTLTTIIDVTDGPGATFNVSDAVAFPLTNFLATVSAEIILISSRTGNVFTIAARGVESTAIVTHAAAEQIGNTFTAGSRQIVKQAAIDTQNYLFNYKGTIVDRLSDPTPLTPVKYDQYLVEAPGVNAWAGQDDNLAFWDGTAWEFIVPTDGNRLYSIFDDAILKYQIDAWVNDESVPVYDDTLPWIDGSVFLIGDELWMNIVPLPIGTPFDPLDLATFTQLTGSGAAAPISTWTTSTLYKVGAVVTDPIDNLLYRATVQHTSGIGTLLDDLANWELISSKYLGVWDIQQDYRVDDVVLFSLQFYKAALAIGVGAGDPIVNSDWDIVSGSNFTDANFRVSDDVDLTKLYALELSTLTTGVTRTTTPANRDMDLGRVSDDYQPGAAYNLGDLSLFNDGIYRALVPIPVAPITFVPLDWILLSNPAAVTAPGRQSIRITTNTTLSNIVQKSSPVIICDNVGPITVIIPQLIVNTIGNHMTFVQNNVGTVTVQGENNLVIIDGVSGPGPILLDINRQIYDWYLVADNTNNYESDAFASALNDLIDVETPTPADGDVLTFDSGSGDWINSPFNQRYIDSISHTTLVNIIDDQWYEVANFSAIVSSGVIEMSFFDGGVAAQTMTIAVAANSSAGWITQLVVNNTSLFNNVRITSSDGLRVELQATTNRAIDDCAITVTGAVRLASFVTAVPITDAVGTGVVIAEIPLYQGTVALAMDDLTDVIAPTPSVNDVLTWDGSDWINTVVVSSSATLDVFKTAHGFTVLDQIYHNGSVWVNADVAAAATLKTATVSKIIDANNFVLQTHGILKLIGHGLTIGTDYFLGGGGGSITPQPITGLAQATYKVLDLNHVLIQDQSVLDNT